MYFGQLETCLTTSRFFYYSSSTCKVGCPYIYYVRRTTSAERTLKSVFRRTSVIGDVRRSLVRADVWTQVFRCFGTTSSVITQFRGGASKTQNPRKRRQQQQQRNVETNKKRKIYSPTMTMTRTMTTPTRIPLINMVISCQILWKPFVGPR
jgi:hypothetical protein